MGAIRVSRTIPAPALQKLGQLPRGSRQPVKAEVCAYALEGVGGAKGLLRLPLLHCPAEFEIAPVIQEFGNESPNQMDARQPLFHLGVVSAQYLITLLNRHWLPPDL